MRIYIYVFTAIFVAVLMTACAGSNSGSMQDPNGVTKDTQTAGLSGSSSEGQLLTETTLYTGAENDPFETAEWDIVTFIDPRDSSIYEIIDGRVIIALKNPPSLPEVDPNYFDTERLATDPVYSQVTYYYTMTTGTDGFQTATTDTGIAAFLQAENLTVYSEWPEVGGIAVTLPEGQTVADAVANWPTEYPSLIDTVDPDAILDSCAFPYTMPDDEHLIWEWHLFTDDYSYPTDLNDYSANVFSAWQQGELGLIDRVVAVIDTGVCAQTEDLSLASTPHGVNTGDKRRATEIKLRSQGGGEPWDWLMERSQGYAGGLGHGTLVAGMISATPDNDLINTYNDERDIAGIAPNCRYFPIASKGKGYINSEGYFASKFSMSAHLHAMTVIGITKRLPAYNVSWIPDGITSPYYNIEVVNMSRTKKGSGNKTGNRHLEYLGRYMLFIASAGNNNNCSRNYWPACHPNVMAVAAHDKEGKRWKDSNYQPYVEISAPGINIYTTDMKGYTSNGYFRGYNNLEVAEALGTSMSAPIVSGAALLVTSKWPSLWPSMVRVNLISTAGKLDDPELSAMGHTMGHVDVFTALNPPY